LQKRIAILGAGIYNIQVYEKLQEAGFYTIAVDGNEAAPAKDSADEFLHLNFTDKELLFAALKEKSVDAIMPINDWGTQSAAYVNAQLGLKGITEKAALASTDKGLMRDTWSVDKIPNPDYFVFCTLEELKSNIETVGFPCVIKPTDSGGSGRGISVLKCEDDLEWAYNFAKPFVRNNRLICEGFVEGIELTIESLSINGEVHILACSDKEKPNLRTRVAMSLNYPAALSIEQKERVYSTVKKAVLSLGIDTGMAHTEVIINGMDIKMVETGARGGGGHIFHTIIEAVSGICTPVALAHTLTDESFRIGQVMERGSVYRFFTVPKGILREVKGMADISTWKGILDIGMIK
jgi:formate-dependent phosphoribosylglycinamide formyltransferase (GAR transformylase)